MNRVHNRRRSVLAVILPLFAPLAATSLAAGAVPRTELVSVAGSGGSANASSQNPDVSADGRYVVFQSFASNLVAADTNGAFDGFVRDRRSGRSTRVSVSSAGRQGNGGSFEPSISANGRFVAFGSEASDLVRGDTNRTTDLFVHDRITGRTTRVSVSSSGVQGNGESAGATISAYGRLVVFTSDASNLVGC